MHLLFLRKKIDCPFNYQKVFIVFPTWYLIHWNLPLLPWTWVTNNKAHSKFNFFIVMAEELYYFPHEDAWQGATVRVGPATLRHLAALLMHIGQFHWHVISQPMENKESNNHPIGDRETIFIIWMLNTVYVECTEFFPTLIHVEAALWKDFVLSM
jgi:hypothetical protein